VVRDLVLKPLAQRTAIIIADKLGQAIKYRGRASLLVSGGSSPKSVYEALSTYDLPWDKVTISLVDERWIVPEQAGSNESFIRTALLINKAAAATFISLKTRHKTVTEGLPDVELRLQNIPRPFDICVMGMGLDGHTASWFPNSQGLRSALDIDNIDTVCAIDADGCPGAGDYRFRITMTLSAVMNSRHIMLYIPGAEKADVFAKAKQKSIYEAPVKTLLAAGERFTLFSEK